MKNQRDDIFAEKSIDSSGVLKQVYEGFQEIEQMEVPDYDTLYRFFESHGMIIYNYYDYFSSEPMDITAELQKLSTADLKMCCVLMTAMFRENHFDNFAFVSRCEKGDVQKVISRMMEVINNG